MYICQDARVFTGRVIVGTAAVKLGLARIDKPLGLMEEGMAKRLTVSYSAYHNAKKRFICAEKGEA